MEGVRAEIVAEILPVLNKRRAKLCVMKAPENVPPSHIESLPELRVDRINGDVEMLHPPLPEINTIAGAVFQEEKKSVSAQTAEKERIYAIENAKLDEVIVAVESGMKLSSEISTGYFQCIKLAKAALIAAKDHEFAVAELARLNQEYAPLKKKLEGTIIWGRKDVQAEADALIELMNKLHTQTQPDDESKDPYEMYAVQACLDKKTKAEFDLSQLLSQLQVKIAQHRAELDKVKAATTLKFIDPVFIDGHLAAGKLENKVISRNGSHGGATDSVFRDWEFAVQANSSIVKILEGAKNVDILTIAKGEVPDVENPFPKPAAQK